MRRTASIIVLSALLATAGLASLASAATTATAPHGILTAVEYQTLSRSLVQVQDVLRSKRIDWRAAYAACPASSATPLLKVETVDCAAGVGAVRALIETLEAVKQEPSCAKQADKSALTCLLPAYEDLAGTMTSAVTLDGETFEAATQRGFTGTCLATLASSPKGLSNERRFAAVLDETVAAMRSENAPALEKLAPELTKTMDAAMSAPSLTDLAVCRHQ